MQKNIGFSSRIKELIANDSLASFSQNLNISVGSVRNYLSGGLPAADTALKIADKYNVNIRWLITGEGEKEKKSTPQPSTAFDIELYNLIILKTEIIIAKNLITITPQKRLEIYQSVYDFLKETSVNHEEIVSDNLNKIIHLMVA